MTTQRDSLLEGLAAQGRETAFRLLASFERERLVPSFVEEYVRQHNRRELKTSPLRYRELLMTLTRESLVAVAAHISAELPRRMAGPRAARQTAAQATAVDAFQQAFVEAVAAALRWTPGDAAEFARDVALYGRMTAVSEPPPGPPARAGRDASASSGGIRSANRDAWQLRSMRMAPRSPFADRCAMLLDPSLMEKARASASAFHVTLERLATKTLAETFRKRTPASSPN